MSELLTEVTPQSIARAVLENHTEHARRDVVTTVFSFKRGAYRGEPLARLGTAGVVGSASIVRPFGAKWPDGSWRTACVSFPVMVDKSETQWADFAVGAGVADPWEWGAGVLRTASVFGLMLRVGGNQAGFSRWEVLEANHLLRTWRSTVRIPDTPIVARFWLQAYSELDHMRFWLDYVDSDTGDAAVTHALGAAELFVTGPRVMIRHGRQKLTSHRPITNGIALEIEPGSVWANGEGQAVAGVLVFPGPDLGTAMAEWLAPIHVVGDDWRYSGAFGPWGYVPECPEDREASHAELLSLYKKYHERDSWQAPILGCAPTPGETGDQKDFSTVVLTRAASGFPAQLHAAEPSVRQEACRPTHIRHPDGSPVRFFSEHPGALLWSGVVHSGISTDTLGKASQLAAWDAHKSSDGRSWWGHDRQHWSVNYLATYALLTGDLWAVEECHHKVELWLGEMRINSPSPSLNGMGAARAVGRTLQAACMLYLVTGREDLAERIRQRVDIVVEQWAGRDTAPIRPLEVAGPDPRKLDGEKRYWQPWQDALAVLGLEFVARTLDYEPASNLSRILSFNVVEFGIWRETVTPVVEVERVLDEGARELAAGWWWEPKIIDEGPVLDCWCGSPATRSLDVDPEPIVRYTCGDAIEWLPGGFEGGMRVGYAPFLLWAGPCCLIAQRYGQESERLDLALKAIDVVQQLRSGPFDWRVHEWLAIPDGVSVGSFSRGSRV